MEFVIFNVHNDITYVSACCAHKSETSSEALKNLHKNLNFSIYFFFSTPTWNSLQNLILSESNQIYVFIVFVLTNSSPFPPYGKSTVFAGLAKLLNATAFQGSGVKGQVHAAKPNFNRAIWIPAGLQANRDWVRCLQATFVSG